MAGFTLIDASFRTYILVWVPQLILRKYIDSGEVSQNWGILSLIEFPAVYSSSL